ncbi:MAG TPA: twin-arginine translocase subunit TatC [Acidimicrobiia bacterium]|nr:twin-arginine translocase subunit TatC [Acidimicrobiia bacterium]
MNAKAGTEVHDDSRMTLMEHLAELRKRIIISLIAIAVCTIVVFFLYHRVLHFLAAPYERVTKGDPRCATLQNPHGGCSLVVTDPLGPLLIRLRISAYGGLTLAVPFVFYQIWRFVTPGLHRNERRYAISFLLSAVVLFALGAVVAWFTVDKAFDFLLSIGGHTLQPFIDANKYLTLLTLMILAFGVAFEFPLLIMFLLLARIVNTGQLSRSRRWMAVGITTFAAIITPSQDPFSLLFMAIPMYIFFEITILLGKLLKR